MTELLKVQNIHKRYGGIHALKGVDLTVRKGEVHALLGENGAGKSTLGKIVAGVAQQDSGEIYLDGRKVELTSPYDAQRMGIGIIFQELDLFPELTVGENIVIGNLQLEKSAVVKFKELNRYCRKYLKRAGLECSPDIPLKDLSIAQMQQTAIARALSMQARVVIMDEPTSALPEEAVSRLFALIRQLTSEGVSVIYVSHKLSEIFEISDRITVLRDGDLVKTLDTGKTDKGELIRLMVGHDLAEKPSGESNIVPDSEVVLSLKDLTTVKLKEISFDLRKGEVLGIAGLVGAGRSALGAALFGIDRILSGEIRLGGEPISPESPRDAISRGIGLVPEDRKLQGLMMKMNVRENTSLSILEQCQKAGFILKDRERLRVRQIYEKIEVKMASVRSNIDTLSGGNQQKVLLARWLLVNPDVIFLDDPTRGVDVGAKEDIYRIIESLAGEGKGIIMVSSELSELLRCSDRIMVLHEGENMEILDARRATKEQIMKRATKTYD